MSADGLKITLEGGVYHLAGVLNENADLSELLKAASPLKIDLGKVTRFNSIGIRNMLKFLQGWGSKPFEYHACPAEFINQINMIPSLLGSPRRTGSIASLYVPYECDSCEFETDLLTPAHEVSGATESANLEKPCPKCGSRMAVPVDTFFLFLTV